MKQILLLSAALLVLSGCALFTKGLDVCQEDACFMGLAAEAEKKDNVKQAREFCSAIISEQLKLECLEQLK